MAQKTTKKVNNRKKSKIRAGLSEVVQQLAIPTFVIDTGHKVTHWNRACELLTGCSAKRMIGTQDAWKAFYAENRPTLADLVVNLAPEHTISSYYSGKYAKSELIEGAYEAQGYFPHLGEQGKWLYFTAAPFKSPSGKLLGAIETFQDITDRKNVEEAYRKSDERLKLALDSVSDAVWDWQVDTDKIYFSSRWYAMLGYEPYELPQKFETFRSLIHPDDLANVDNTVTRHIKLAEPLEIEFRMRTKDGRWRWILARGKAVQKDEQGKAVRMLGIHMDITHRKQMEARLRQAQKLESIGNLAGGIAHDFNNILFPIIGMSEMLMEDFSSDSPEYENIREIYKASRRGSNLVKQILAFSRQSDKPKTPVGIQHIVKEVLKLTRSTIPANIEIAHNIQNDCGLVEADSTQIHQIAMNLMTNAYHAVEATGGKISVGLKEISLDAPPSKGKFLQPGPYARLSITDTGTGIDPAVIDKIFEPYFTTKKQGKGTGLGLAQVYGIVRDHLGDIRVHSVFGKGTCFEIFLPVIRPHTEEISEEKNKADLTGTENIMLVDDEDSILKIERIILERLGYRVTTHTKSLKALEAFRTSPDSYDLVITDMTMPAMTGIQLAERIKEIRPDCPVILCTGFSEGIDPKRAEDQGIKGFLMKPVLASDLAQTVSKLLAEANAGTGRVQIDNE